jgi:polynucleotide 5'-kinase involved in rRNA processing
VLNRILSVTRRNPEVQDEDVVCAYLETDLGQPEFTPSGLVSLHLMRASDAPLLGAAPLVISTLHCTPVMVTNFPLDFTDIDLPQKGLPHTHLRQHTISFFIGDSSPKREPVQYLAVVQKAGRSVDNVFISQQQPLQFIIDPAIFLGSSLLS